MSVEAGIHDIIISYLNGSISENEQAQLTAWLHASEDNTRLFEQLTGHQFLMEELQKFYRHEEEPAWKRVQARLAMPSKEIPVKNYQWRRWVMAASLVGICFLALFVFTLRNKPGSAKDPVIVRTDVEAPKGTKAVIHLSNGQTVSLDSIGSGKLAQQGDVNVVKDEDGQIIYQGAADKLVYNTLFNPRGGTVVSLVLTDGTKVWLNSESSLRYPTAFTDKERTVELTGEAYFEVTKNPAQKFIVNGNGVRTEVLGTHFNMNAYRDEGSVKVTLLEGSVKVGQDLRPGITIKPGQQAGFSNKADRPVVEEVDIDKVIAWKTGVFSFDEDDLPVVMRQLARWYDLQVNYSGAMPKEKYSGLISRQLSLVQVLKILNMAGIKYTIEDNRISIESNNQ